MKSNDSIPMGWSFNPSAWSKRIPLLILATLGLLIALYLGLYQLNIFRNVCEPFFGNGTDAIVKSSFSRSLPVPDGLIGAFGYLCDIILISIGDSIRWKTNPVAVTVYAIFVGLMGLVSILLIIIQPVILQSWCTLCLASAAISLSLVIPAFHEWQAARHHIKSRKGLEIFWKK